MKKKFLLIIIILLILTGCVTSPKDDNKNDNNKNNINELIVYTINDFHGDILDPDESLSLIGNFLIGEKEKNPNTVLISAGDMFQGTALSNITKGDLVVEAMNYIGFDAMTIGNHEFDWGLDIISQFHDGKDLDANFPFLAANIYEKDSNELVSWAEPYTVIDRGNIKIGILGLIGQSLTNSIAPSIIKDYYFTNEFNTVEYYVPILRAEEDCDIVIVSVHGDTKIDNQRYANLSGEYQVDALINGHTHQSYNFEVMGSDNIPMPVVQAASDGRMLGKIVIELDENNKMHNGKSSLITVNPRLSTENSAINAIVNKYNEQVKLITDEVLGIAALKLTNNDGAVWAATALQIEMGVDVAIINSGGIRSAAFPIEKNEAVTVGHIWRIMPFDNIVKTVDMSAGDFVFSYYRTSCRLSANAKIYGDVLSIDGLDLDDDTIISVATIDYLFDNNNYRYMDGENQVNTEILFRDLLIDNLRKLLKGKELWYGNAK